MKNFTLKIFIFFFGLIQLTHAQPLNLTLSEFQDQWKKWNSVLNKDEFKIVKKDIIVEDKKECQHCPGYLKLTSSVNKILEKLSEDEKYDNLELPVQVSKLKMKYFVEYSKNKDEVKCKKFETLEYAILNEDRKLLGQAKFVASEFFKLEGFDNLTYLDPKTQSVSYYYQDENDKDVLVQVHVEKNQPAKINYFKYYPSENEEKKIVLPEMRVAEKEAEIKPDPVANIGGVELKYRPKLTKKGILPDVKVGEAKVEKEIVGGILVKGDSNITLINGGESNIGFKTSQYDLASVKLKTKINGEFDHYLVVPYEVPVKIMDKGFRGEVADNKHETILSLNFISDDKVLLKASTAINKQNGKDSYLLSKELKTEGNGTIVFSAGKQETGSHFASIKNVQKLNKNTVMSVDLKFDSEKKTTLYYTLTSYFK